MVKYKSYRAGSNVRVPVKKTVGRKRKRDGKTRKFGGKNFRFQGTYDSKEYAQKLAKTGRETMHRNVRIVPHKTKEKHFIDGKPKTVKKDAWSVYDRPKPRRKSKKNKGVI